MKSEIIGLIPAGGIAARIAPLPCSKEILPVGFQPSGSGGSLRPRVAADYLLERLRLGGIERAFFIVRPGKWDIPAYFGDGHAIGMALGYLMMRLPYGSPYTLDQAYPFVRGARVALGFPDILFEPADAFAHLVAHQESSRAEVVLGLFPHNQPHTADMVHLEPDGQVSRIVIKQPDQGLAYSWMIALWTATFSDFLHTYLIEHERARATLGGAEPLGRELYVGDVVQAAINAGMRIEGLPFPAGNCLDIGTPANLVEAIRRGTPGHRSVASLYSPQHIASTLRG